MRRLKSKVTIYDIAREADVSIMTVSRALHPESRDKVAPSTLKSIEAVIRRFNYTPNSAAQNLSAARTKTIGILLSHFRNVFLSDYYSKILSGVSNELLHSDYRFKIVALKERRTKWDGYRFKTAEGVDGLIAIHWHPYFSNRENLNILDLPCVVINDPQRKVRPHFVCCDNVKGGELAAEYLFSKGHRRIAVVTGPAWSQDSRERVTGFKGYLKRMNVLIPKNFFWNGNFLDDDAYSAVRKHFRKEDRISAIFCVNDHMAYGTIRQLKEQGIACPQQISVIGFDDEGGARHFDPPLTTIHHPVIEIAQKATEILINYLKGKNQRNFYLKKTIIPVSLIERNSVKAFKKR